MSSHETSQQQQLTYKWLAGVVGAILFFGFTAWISSVQADISDLEKKTESIPVLIRQSEDQSKQLDRIEGKLDELNKTKLDK